MIDEPNLEKMKLIQRYTTIKADLQASVDNQRPVCPALSGDLVALAEKLHCNESTETWLRELQEQHRQGPPSSPGRIFHGVID